jgi:hypothetical protein
MKNARALPVESISAKSKCGATPRFFANFSYCHCVMNSKQGLTAHFWAVFPFNLEKTLDKAKKLCYDLVNY